MKFVLYGATGTIGSRILTEALARGHQVTAIVRDPAKLALKHANLTVAVGDARDPAAVAKAVAGSAVMVSALSPGHDDPQGIVGLTRALVGGLTQAGVKRLVMVGGAGSLEVAPGQQLVDQPFFPAAWKGIALAHSEALAVLRTAALDWTSFSPPALIEPGTRTGTFRLGTDQLVTDAAGNSRISAEDYAVALVDELEKPQFIRRRFTAAY